MTIRGIRPLWRVLVRLVGMFLKSRNHQRLTATNRPVPFARTKALDKYGQSTHSDQAATAGRQPQRATFADLRTGLRNLPNNPTRLAYG